MKKRLHYYFKRYILIFVERSEMMPLEQMMTLKSLRVRCRLTQEEVANRLGISRRTLSKWEQDSSDMPIKYMQQFADIYNYPLNYIFFGNSIALSNNINSNSNT